MALVQGVADGSSIIGTATLRFNMDGSFLFALDMGELAGDGAAVITDGNSCGDDMSVTPYTSEGTGQDFDGTVNSYEVLAEGISQSAFRFNNGFTRDENLGKTVLIYYDSNPTEVVACGVLAPEQTKKVLTAEMGTYPGYDGDLTPVGKVTVSFRYDDSFLFQYDVTGLETSCIGCGIHIHAGTSCETHELVEGHGWNNVVVQDLWTAAGGATYSTDDMGNAKGYFELFNGYGYEENYLHAVVIHMQDGKRVGCGQLL